MGKVLKPVGRVVSTILGGKPPNAPTVAAPTPMPTPDDDAMRAARRRAAAAAQQRSGRASTILGGATEQRDTLGG